MHYFKSRSDAGKELSKLLANVGEGKCAVVALSKGALLVADEVANALNGNLFIFTTDDVNPNDETIATAIMASGVFSYTTSYALGELEEDKEALRFFTDARHINEFQNLNHICGHDGIIPKSMLKNHTVILVSDGIKNALSLEIASVFLRPIAVKQVVLATPVASSEVIDKMHSLVDQIFCLSTIEGYLSTDHYYQESKTPTDKTVVEILKNNVFKNRKKPSDLAANK